MFRKRVIRSLRQKTAASEESSEEEAEEKEKDDASSKATTLVPNDSDKSDLAIKPTLSSSSLLSFPLEEEESGETFMVKKTRRRKHERRHVKRGVSSAPSALNESRTETESCEVEVTEVKVVRSNVVFSGVDAEKFDEEVEPNDEFGKFREILSSGVIPDAKMIHMARKRRQLARETGEFVPLDDTKKFEKDSSRLVREDENDASDSGEEGGKFYSRLRSQHEEERRQMEEDFLNAVEGSDEERDVELEQWEQEQMRKGVSVQQISQYHQEQSAIEGGAETKPRLYPEYAMLAPPSEVVVQWYNVAPFQSSAKEIKEPQPMDIDIELPTVETVDKTVDEGACEVGAVVPESDNEADTYSLDDVIAKVTERVDSYGEVKKSYAIEAEQARLATEENREMETKLTDIKPELRIQYSFFQQTFSFVTDLLDCLNEKMPLIRKVVDEMTSLMESRARFFACRRQQDMKDQYEECTAAGSGNLQLLLMNSERMLRAAEREARRSRRRQAREKLASGASHRDGMSSDDEEVPSRIVTFNAQTEQIKMIGAAILTDVLEDFTDARHIADRFTQWYCRFPKPYAQAFASICLPKLLMPFVELEMLTWSPLEADAQELESFYWYETLLTYGYCPNEPDDAGSDPDIYNLIPMIIEKFVCVRVTELIQRVWDPTSSSQTQRLANFLGKLVSDYPCVNVQGKPTQALLTVLHSRLKSSLDEDLFMPIYSKEVLENRGTGAAVFLDRQFWFAVKCLKNVLCFQTILSNKTAQELAIDSILNRHLVLGLQCSLVTDMNILNKAKFICNLLPSDWFEDLCGEDTLPQLEPLCKALLRIGDGLLALPLSDRGDTRDCEKEVCRLLTKLHALKYAHQFAAQNKLKL